MIFNAIYPIIEFLLYYFFRFVIRLWDSRCSLNKYSTRAKSIRGYVDVHSGPIFFIYFKYSLPMNIVFVTMLFGFGMPILFPIAALSFLIMYITEMALLYYSYKAPPQYNQNIS